MIRRILLRSAIVAMAFAPPAFADEPLNVGSRRELFVDGALVGKLTNARRVLHHPTPREIFRTHDAPWEGSGSGYHSVFRDGDRYRMYYSRWQTPVG